MPKGIYPRKKKRAPRRKPVAFMEYTRKKKKTRQRQPVTVKTILKHIRRPARKKALAVIAAGERGPVKIKTISFRSMIELRRFQHAHIEVTADVPVGGGAADTLNELKHFVAEQLRIVKEGRTVQPAPGSFRSLLEDTFERDTDDPRW